MTYFHQGNTHHEPVWIDQTPGARSNTLPGPWPIEDENAPDGTAPAPTPPPDPDNPVVTTHPVFNVAAADDPVIRDDIRENFRAALNRWNALLGYTTEQRNRLRASWTGNDGTVWNGSTLWPQPELVRFRGDDITVTKVHYFAGGSEGLVTVAFAGRVLPEQDQNTNQLSQGYLMGVNTDLIGVLSDQDWQDTFAHELAHALGFQASCWTTNVNPVERSLDGGAYPTGRDNYRTLTNSTATNILLGSENSHWENQTRNGIRGFQNELLIAGTDADTPRPLVISSLTLGVARDQGYQVIGEPEGTPLLTNVRGAPYVQQPPTYDTVTILYDNYYTKDL